MPPTIRITGEINDESFRQFSEQLAEIETSKNRPQVVAVELFSHGGETYAALAFAARMKASPHDIHVTAYGYVASAAILILAAGDLRYMSKMAWAMVHEDQMSGEDGSIKIMEAKLDHLREIESQWCQLLSEMTKTDAETWGVLHELETYLSADKCLELGLVDELF